MCFDQCFIDPYFFERNGPVTASLGNFQQGAGKLVKSSRIGENHMQVPVGLLVLTIEECQLAKTCTNLYGDYFARFRKRSLIIIGYD